MSLYHEVMEALTPLVEMFEQLGITYYIGGSVSSSLHGLARRTQDVDVIADVEPSQVRSLVPLLQHDYYVDEQAWKDAVRRGLPYNVIHLTTMLKVDLIPLKRRAFTREEARRAQRCEVTHTTTSSPVSLTEVISRPSGKGKNGDADINLLE